MSGGDKQIGSVSYWLVKVKQCEQGEEYEVKILHPSHSLVPRQAGGEGKEVNKKR